MTIRYMYDPVCDWYTRDTIYEKNGEKYIYTEHVMYYYGSTNIPQVKRKKPGKKLF